MARTMRAIFNGALKATNDEGYCRIHLTDNREGVLFGSNLRTSLEADSWLCNSVSFSISSTGESGIVFLAINYTGSPTLKTAFINVRRKESGELYIGLKDSDLEFIPPMNKQCQVSNCGKFFRFMMDGIWYTTNPKEKGPYPYIPASNGNLICEYIFEKDATKEAELTGRLRRLVSEHEAEKSEVCRLKEALKLEREEKSLLAYEKAELLSGINGMRLFILNESRSRGNRLRFLKANESMRSLIWKIDEKVHELLPEDYGQDSLDG